MSACFNAGAASDSGASKVSRQPTTDYSPSGHAVVRTGVSSGESSYVSGILLLSKVTAILRSRRSLTDPVKHPIQHDRSAGWYLDLGGASAIKHPIFHWMIAT